MKKPEYYTSSSFLLCQIRTGKGVLANIMQRDWLERLIIRQGFFLQRKQKNPCFFDLKNKA